MQGVLRTPAEGEGGVAHRENFSAAASATLERSAGTVAHGKRAARERRRRRSKVSGRRRAGHAPPARRGRRVRVPRAFKRPAKTFGGWVVVVRTPTPNYLRQASPDRGKYVEVCRPPQTSFSGSESASWPPMRCDLRCRVTSLRSTVASDALGGGRNSSPASPPAVRKGSTSGGLPRSETMPKLRSEVDEEIGVPVSIHTKRGSKPGFGLFLRLSAELPSPLPPSAAAAPASVRSTLGKPRAGYRTARSSVWLRICNHRSVPGSCAFTCATRQRRFGRRLR